MLWKDGDRWGLNGPEACQDPRDASVMANAGRHFNVSYGCDALKPAFVLIAHGPGHASGI